jgi:hypothetical protein
MAAPSAQFMTDLKVNMTPDTVDVRTSPTLNNYGERSYTGSTTTYDAYITRRNDAGRGLDTDDIDYDYIVYIPDASLTLNVQDQITLPSPVSAVRPIVKVSTRKDPLGQVGVVAYVGGA